VRLEGLHPRSNDLHGVGLRRGLEGGGVPSAWFSELVRLAGLTSELSDRQKISAASHDLFNSNWATVRDWKPESRYISKTEAEARDLFEAITHRPDGVLRWLKNYW
jgi:hypothetical protein